MPTAMVTFNGRITLPPQIRKQLHLKTGDSVDFVEIGKDRFAISLQPGLSPAAEVSAQPLDYLPKAGKITQPVH